MFNKNHFKYLIKLFLLALSVMLTLRVAFIIFHFKKIVPFSISQFFETFIIGTLFDSVVISSFFIILIIITIILKQFIKTKALKFSFILINLILGIFFFINIIDVFYFEQYGTRINSLISEANNNTDILITTIWKMFPVIWVILFFTVLQFIFYKIHKKIFLKLLDPDSLNSKGSFKWTIFSFITYSCLSFLYYGPPLWTLSEFSSSSVLNQASMNGVYCLCESFHQNIIYKNDIPIYNFYDNKKAISIFQNSIISSNDSVLRVDLPSLRFMKKQDSCTFNKKNIVIIIMESFGSKHIGCLNDNIGFSPKFDSLSKKGILFTNFKANGPRTQNGVISALSGFPSILGINLQRRKGINEFQTIGNILFANGYNTNFIHNGYANYDDIDEFLKQGGFNNIIDVNNFSTWRYKNEWGISDEDLYEKAYDFIWEINNKPSLTVLLTMSNHPPFETPENFKTKHPEINNMTIQKAALYYSDFALGEFIQKCSKNIEYKNTVFYILADHSEYESGDNELNIFEIPLLILNSTEKNKINNTLTSQCDIPSTILGELNYSGNYHFIGQNILDSNYCSFAFSRDFTNNIYYYKNNYVLKYNLETSKSRLFRRDGNTCIELKNKMYSEDNLIMKEFSESYIQTISLIFRRGKYRFDLKSVIN